jgi:hypothetical protein
LLDGLAWARLLIGLVIVRRARLVGEQSQRSGNCVAEFLQSVSQLRAAGGGESPEQPAGAFERLGELLAQCDAGG